MDWKFISFINSAMPNTTPDDLLLDELGELLLDWDTFFAYYMANAPPPTMKTTSIKNKFTKIRARYKKCLSLYYDTQIKTLNSMQNYTDENISLILPEKNDEGDNIDVV